MICISFELQQFEILDCLWMLKTVSEFDSLFWFTPKSTVRVFGRAPTKHSYSKLENKGF